jgi:hypothetical protein
MFRLVIGCRGEVVESIAVRVLGFLAPWDFVRDLCYPA